MATNLFAELVQTPAAQTLRQRAEAGGVLPFDGVAAAAQPFWVVLLRELVPQRPILVVTDSLKTQEVFQQDLETWLAVRQEGRVEETPGAGQRQAPGAPTDRKPHAGNDSLELAAGPPPLGPIPRAGEMTRAEPTADRMADSPRPLFYPAWEILPHEARLPHADVISERLETLVALLDQSRGAWPEPPLVTTTITALLQRTFPPEYLRAHTRRLTRGQTLDPLDLIEWLEAQGYEPEAQVTQKGEIAWRGGILDVYPLSSPWPVRLEFFGNELESLRYFDPFTQISRREIQAVWLPPAGELGLLKRWLASDGEAPSSGVIGEPNPVNNRARVSTAIDIPVADPALETADPTPATHSQPAAPGTLATLLDYLPQETIVVLCEPEELAEHAALYMEQLPSQSPLVISWGELQERLARTGFTRLELREGAQPLTAAAALSHQAPRNGGEADEAAGTDLERIGAAAASGFAREPASPIVNRGTLSAAGPLVVAPPTPRFIALDVFRPLAERPPEPHIAEAQRREFFNQLHRWLRQGCSVHVFCNHEGERQRFMELWNEYGLGERPETAGKDPATSAHSPEQAGRRAGPGDRQPEEDVAGLRPRSDSASVASEMIGSPGSVLTQRATSGPPSLSAPLAAGLWPRLGTLSRGFVFDDAKLVVVTDAEIFGRHRAQRPRRLKSPHAAAARSMLDINFADLEEGDYVVHLEHGIGRYLGLQRLARPARHPTAAAQDTVSTTLREGEHAAGRETDEALEYLVIEYAPSQPGETPPKLYVPVTEAHLVGKYVGAGKARPQLHTLGGKRWARAKQQAEHAVRDLAAELLSLQAAREALPGHAFGADTPWQREFESAFPYEETPDQLRAIAETKADMEKPRPMDRLICGDVAFGKTEVALRAAFKAVMDGKQVAVLVPTTVLAQQHFNTFRERMAAYPVRIELLSRFRTRAEQARVVRDLAAGAVDIVIGTHRLVQGDIVFKELGLVIIDEEQRFGVLQKEALKQMRRLVDVLTLSATPIPRTLYLALTGARDLSTIETPPQDRLPVETIVAPYDERLIREAIRRELNRGGQVFFLHNRVQTIDRMAANLQALVPRARIVVGHGQMRSEDLEEVMTRFVNGEADVLLSTTIIESGLDIPNANTIIIDRADRFGLSDLYQLRGRVGRYKHQAYAYLLMPRHARLLSDARKRIRAIQQYSQLGSGFKIAMRDLEIRGAGNLLGPEQSGHITAVGFELYCQLLKQSIAALKGEQVRPRVQVDVRLDFLTLGPAEMAGAPPSPAPARKLAAADAQRIEVPRDVAVQASVPTDSRMRDATPRRISHESASGPSLPLASAYLPFRYIPGPQHRIEIYRKLAQATDKAALDALRAELRDRFGPLPPPVELLLQLADLKLLASERGITAIEVEQDKLKLTRHNDFIMPDGRFPRLTRRAAAARLNEIRKLLLKL